MEGSVRLRKRHRRFGIDALEPRVLLASSPMILMATDAVAPGTSFSVNGTGMTPASVQVAIALEPANGVSPATPPANAIYPTITQTDTNSADGEFVTATMPSTATPGVYDLWVGNANGWSSPYLLNAARSLYQSQYQAYNGMTMEVVGRNFNQNEFGGKTETEVRLNDGTDPAITESIVSLSPYEVSFTVTGATWANVLCTSFQRQRRRLVESQQRADADDHLRPIRPARSGRALGRGFQLEQRVQREQLRCQRHDDQGRDGRRTERGQRGVNAARRVVYFPNGTYYVSHITLPPTSCWKGRANPAPRSITMVRAEALPSVLTASATPVTTPQTRA